MADTTFTDGVTVVPAAWLNDVNTATYRTVINVKNQPYSAVGNGIADDTAAIVAAIVAAKAANAKLVFPAGTYAVSSTLAFGGAGVKNVAYEGQGKVTIQSSAVGPIATIDAGGAGARNDGIQFKNFVLKGTGASTYGLYTRGLQRSLVENIRVVDVATAGFKVDWNVLVYFKNIMVTNNIDTFAVNPGKGLIIDQETPGNYTADCIFDNVVFEGPITNVGIEVLYAGLGVAFRNGTCENIPRGLLQAATAGNIVLENMDFESNTVYDVNLLGIDATLINCDLSSGSSSPSLMIGSTARNVEIFGGFASEINIDASSLATRLFGVKTSDNVSIGITGTGPHQRYGVIRVDTNRLPTAVYSDRGGVAGTFTASLTGCTTVPTSAVSYAVYNGFVTLTIPAITGTSNTTAATLTGMPTSIYPSSTRFAVGVATNNSADAIGRMSVSTAGVITLYNGVSTTFTNSGTKGVQACTITYEL